MDERLAGTFYGLCGKRAFDALVSFTSLVVLSPVLLLCALLVRLTSRGPVFFRQVRLGRYGRPFKVFKFRTMERGAERPGPAPVIPGDKRLTPVGKLLRRSKLDELPQLINVLRGDMSLVGPRPRMAELTDLNDSNELLLLSVRPGLTSYASIYHRMEEDFCQRNHDPNAVYHELQRQKGYLDVEYVRNLSFFLDLKLILLTTLLLFIPGKAQPVATRFFGLEVRPYGRLAQMGLETGVFVAAVWLGYWLRYEGQMSEFHRWQSAAFLVLLPAVRLATNQIFGIYNMMWRYVNLVDAAVLVASLSTVSAILVLLRLLLPAGVSTAHVFQLPLGVIALEYLLVVGGSLGLRGLRRMLYEMDHRYQPLPTDRRRRIVIVGAGLSGLGIALEVGRYPHLELVGFVDKDFSKKGRLMAGYEVLGPVEILDQIVRDQQVTDVIVCVQSLTESDRQHLLTRCQSLGARTHIIPTLDQILSAEL